MVLDTTWTPASWPPVPATEARSAAASPGIIGIRDVAERVLSRLDLIAETSAHLDRWAATSGVVEQLTIRDTSFWFYVRLRHWLWLEERILWAAIADAIVREHRPARIVCALGTDDALIDVLRLVTARDGIELDEEQPPEPGPDNAAPAASTAPSRAPKTGFRHSALARLARRVRDRFRGPPPPPPRVVRQQMTAARLVRVHSLVDALAAEPEARLLVVHEHARQRVETPDGPRSMNPYLDPIVDRLRGTSLEPIVLDIRARAGQDAAWERIGAGVDERMLPADALAIDRTPPPDAMLANAGATASATAPVEV
ncbi:MAG TPA: hypothetical protein VHM48_10805, partial [Candidatus Limnocylindrales bacterium]|nr:hypothetical protein [Candidatus Limnocylindrales bacterium]